MIKMLKLILNRAARTANDLTFYVAPVWHLTNLRREAYDQIEDLHYQVGYCRASKQQVIDRIAEIDHLLERAELGPAETLDLETERQQLAVRLKEAEEMERTAQEVVVAYQESIPKLVSQLDLAIQMTRMNKSQKSVVRMLGRNRLSDGSDVQEHIKKTRSQAYALSEQLSGHLAASRLRRARLLPSKSNGPNE